jgi:hypothetical protein
MNRRNFLMYRWRVTHHWKALNEGYNFSLDLISIGGFHTKLWASYEIPNFGNFETPTWES